MSSLALSGASRPDAMPLASSACFHCGEAVSGETPQVEIDGRLHDVCCRGCAAAATWIRDAGLGDYYRLRQREAARADGGDEDYRLWDRPDLLREHVAHVAGGCEITLLTDRMHCAACAWLIDRALTREPGVEDVSANAVTGRIRLRWNPAQVALSTLLQRLATLGFPPHLAGDEAGERERRRGSRRELLRLGVAGLGAMQTMMFAEALYLDTAQEMLPATRDFLRWVAFLVSTPVVFFSGWPFLAGFARELRQRRLGMDTLVATSVLLAYLGSLAETVRGGPHVWFDAAVMFVLLLLAARRIESAARERALAHVATLARARPAVARREIAGARTETVPVAALRIGDVVCVAPGDAVPADGDALGEAHLDESLLSGESTPVAKPAGDPVYAGSLVRDLPLRVRLTRTGQDTRLSHLVRLVERAQATRPAVARLADLWATRFVLLVLGAAVITALFWLRAAPDRSFEVVLAVLVVSCPCALSLAVPTALAAAHATLARLGVLALRPDALDALARVDRVLFDKTGTLTRGQVTLRDVHVFAATTPEQALSIAAALEQDHRHPIAAAFRAASGTSCPIVPGAVRRVAGRGIEGEVAGRHWRLGRADFAAGRRDDGAVWLGDGASAAARFEVSDALRDAAPMVVEALRRRGAHVALLSGDGHAAVTRVAEQVGIDAGDAHARQTPEDKLEFMRAQQRAGHVVAMLGDGINDAPVLAGADVSFAIAQGAALSHRAADFVLGGERLSSLPAAFDLARRTRRVMRQNLVWAVGYNLVALPFAMLGWVPPWLAAIGMALSSLAVTLNALRLLRTRPAPDAASCPTSRHGLPE